MPNREKVIKGLEHELRNRGKCGHYCREGIETFLCEYDKDGLCIQHWGKGALALLKAQEPRMMTFEEAFHNANTYRTSPDSVKPVFVQFRFEEYADEGLCPPWRGGVNQRALLEQTGAYGLDYVFWTDRPTKEQMEAVQWPDA